MGRVILIIGALILTLLLYRWVRKQPANKRWQYLVLFVGLVLLGFVVTGKLHWLLALAGAAIPAFQRLLSLAAYVPMFKRMASTFKGGQPSTGQSSQVTTQFIEMELDHDSGNLTGKVTSGLFSGKLLNELTLEELLQLHEHYDQQDEDSRLLLENYLDHHFGTDWRQYQQSDRPDADRASSDSRLTLEDAYAILGLEKGASKEAIIKAHKRLMQKLHPDRGGSSYLAIKINQAKELLLSHL